MNKQEQKIRTRLDFAVIFIVVVLVGTFFIAVNRAQGAPLPPHQGHAILPVSAKEAARERAQTKTTDALRIAQRAADRGRTQLLRLP